MGSESEFSSAASDHEDSDTIVISSKSRILISPRKKGSKAVSRLLGSAAADDVVEQILRGTVSSAEVVGRTKSSTVRIGNKEFSREEGRGGSTGVVQQAHTRKTATTERGGDGNRNASRQVSSSQATRNVRVTTVRNTAASHEADAHDESDVSSEEELSAPSSEDEISDDDHETNHPTLNHAQTQQAPQRTMRVSTSKQNNGRAATNGKSVIQDDEAFDSQSDGADSGSHSDASSSTKGSSHSHLEMHSKVTTQRKFDDQIRVSTQTNQSTTRTKHTKSTTATHASEATTANTNGRRSRAVRHAEMSDLDDSIILPTTATQEMEDLKQTLKKLAHQDPAISGASNDNYTSVKLSNPPKGKSASFSDSSRGSGDKLRREEYAGASMDDGYTEAAWSTTAAIARFDESSSKKPHKTKSSRQSRPISSDAGSSDSDQSEPSVARRLFSTPPPRSSKISTPPTVPISSFTSKRTPSQQQSTSFHSAGYTSGLDTSLTAAASSSAQGSRAVLSALKALQDKIRRLEEEREKLLQELSDIKVKARKREAEFASSEKKFSYELGQTKESARAAYDAIRSEKEELKLELVKYEERRKAMEAELKHAHKLSSTYSAKADDLQSQLQMCESERKSVHAEIDAARSAHKQEVRDLRGELATLQKDRDTAQEQIKLLQQQYEREAQNHAETRERLHETEQTIAGISQLNEKLVSKVWEANEIANKATKKTKKLQQSQRVSTLSRPTAASRAASISAANGAATPGRPGSATTKRGRAGSVTAKGATSTKKSTRASSNLELLRAANLGNVPFVLGTSANRSHSIISSVQEAIRQCDTTYVTPVTNSPPTPTHLSTKRTKLKSRKASGAASDNQDPRARGPSATAAILGLDMHDAGRTLVGSRSQSRENAPQHEPQTSMTTGSTARRPSAIRVPAPATSYANPMKSQIMEDLHTAVENAEAEFSALNRKYKDAVKRVESGREGAGQLSASLGSMLDELEAKGKQLNLLKQVYEQASHSTINPVRHIVHSPEAIQRKTASLRILNDYRQMERDAKSPRRSSAMSGRPISPTGTNATSRRASFFSDNE